MRPPEGPPRAATATWLARHLEQRILDGELAPGGQLPSERRLAEEFGLSRAMVREALSRLTERDFLEIQPGRGAFVRPVQPTDAARPLELVYRRQGATARALVEARRMLEGEAAALAAQRASPDEVRHLGTLLDRFDASRSVIERARNDIAFHVAVVRASGNAVIETMFSSIARLALQQMLRSLGDETVSREGIPYHREILDAVEAGDAPRARHAAQVHLDVAQQLYGEDLDRPVDELARQALQRLFGPGFSLDDLRLDLG